MNILGSFLVSIIATLATIFHPAPPALHVQQQRTLDIGHLPYSSGPLSVIGLRTGQVHYYPRPWRGTLFANLTCSPAPCVFPNSQSSGGTQPANETPVVVNSKRLTHLLAGANDYSCSTSIAGFYGSSDGGSTWTRTCADVVSGASGGGGDPVVGYDLKNNAYRGSISFTNSGWRVGIAKSINNGKTWAKPVIAVTPFFTNGLTDKEWLEIDTTPTSRWPNWMYISTTQFDNSSNSQITVSHSTDGGKTWNSPVAVGTEGIYPNLVNQFSDLAITADGTVYVTWMTCTPNGTAGNCGGTVAHIYFSKSNDGGNTWSKQVLIHKVKLAPASNCCFYGVLPNTSERMSDIPVNAVDNTTGPNKGAIYVADYTYTTGKYMKVQVSKSTDGGAHWSKPVGVAPLSDKHDQFMPWVNVSKTGVVGVTWMDRRNDPSNVNYEEFGAYSTDGGATYPTNYQIATNPSNPFNDGFGGSFIGDYSGNAWSGKALYASWTDTSNGSFDQAMLGGLLTP